MADTKTYNGHANWATWNVCLWIDNNEGMYRAKMRFIRCTLLTPAKVEAFVRELFPHGTPDMGGSPKDLDDVDFDEVCESWKEDENDE